MKISEIAGYLESLSPLSFMEDYDNCGLLIGDPEEDADQALVCLDLTEKVIDEAMGRKCSLVISHHPVIFKGVKKLTPSQPESAVVIKAIKHNIAVYAIHTNLDNTLHGLNAFLFKKLGIESYKILSPKEGMLRKLAVFCPVDYAVKVRQAMFDAGAGRIGNYDCCSYNVDGEGTFRASAEANPFVGEKNAIHSENETRIEVVFLRHLEKIVIEAMISAHPYEEVAYDLFPLNNKFSGAGSGLLGELSKPTNPSRFLDHLKEKLLLPLIRHTALPEIPIKRIALCSGSGSFLIGEALRAKADIFITADLKYHDFFTAAADFMLLDIGHYESEIWVKEWLHDVLIEKFPTFAVLISEVNTNPVHYY